MYADDFTLIADAQSMNIFWTAESSYVRRESATEVGCGNNKAQHALVDDAFNTFLSE